MSEKEQEAQARDGVEFSWRVHGALDSWTGKVDSKASISLAIEAAAFGFVLTLSEDGKQFAGLHGCQLWWYRIGIALLLVSVLLSLLVVLPQLNRRKSKRAWRSGMIYFGHLRHWDPKELASALSREQPYEQQLAHQLVAMAQIAWRKHAWLQWSLIALGFGVACLLAATVG